MDIKTYGETDTEKEQKAMIKAREIVHEIMNFGVSQAQIVQIIRLLSLEIEDRALMVAIRNAASSGDSSTAQTRSGIIT